MSLVSLGACGFYGLSICKGQTTSKELGKLPKPATLATTNHRQLGR